MKRLVLAWALLMACGGVFAADGWVPPNANADAENKWTNEAKAYDGNLVTYASDGSNRAGNGAWRRVKSRLVMCRLAPRPMRKP